jgi:hypothetical protein
MPPAFFVPDASDGAQAEQVYQSVRSCVRGQSPGRTITDRRIYQLDYTYDGQDYRSRVGAVKAVAGLRVVTILEATNGAERLFFVCTPNRGGTPGLPVYPGSRQVQTAATLRGRSQRTDCRAADPALTARSGEPKTYAPRWTLPRDTSSEAHPTDARVQPAEDA